jgi:tetratricopeptide (TPR) repeat protein
MGKAGEQIKVVRVVIVSPGDVAKERVVAQGVVDELNRGVAADRGCRLSLWRWETDARSGMHVEGPQGLLDEMMDIQDADVVVGVFWRRFGTPTGEEDSGTEHELRRAWDAWQQHGRPDVMVYFCTRPYSPRASDELAQWQRVLEFRDAMPEQQLWWPYESVGQFETLLREHLTRLVLRGIAAPASGVSSRAARSRVRFNLPAVATSFTGREGELDALDDALGVADRAVITQTITGLGGVGKSQLAARYVQQRADGYDVVAWVRAEDGGIADLAALAGKLGASVEGLSPSERAQLALELLGDGTQRWLLVLDNVGSPEQLEDCRPRTGSGRVLVTSRDRAMRQFGPVLSVDVFAETTATTYLTDRADRPGDERAARELARALGCLPLALSHAAAYCQSGTTFTDYLELLGELPARDLFDSHPELSYSQTVASTWKTSTQAASKVAALATDVLEMAAYLGPDAMPKSLFSVLVDVDTALGRKRLMDAFNALARFSLATVDDDSLSVHRLLQKVIREDATGRGDQAAALRCLAALCDAFPDDVRLPQSWPLCERLLPHILALADTLEQPGDEGPQLIKLLNGACYYLNRAEPGQRGLGAARRTLRHAERVLAAEHPETLAARSTLADAYHEAGRPREAIAIYEPLLADRARILGAEHPDTLTAREVLALAYQAAGRVGEGIAILEALVADRVRILGAEHPQTLTTRHNLADFYQWGGRVDEAIAIYEPLLADKVRVLGAEHPYTLNARHGLADTCRKIGRVDEAIAILEALVADRVRILGAEHQHTLHARHSLADAYQTVGRVDEAIAIFEALLADRVRIFGTQHPATLYDRHGLALAYRAAGRVDEAIAILEALQADQEEIVGAQHPQTLAVRHSLADAYRALGASPTPRSS